MRFNKTLLIVLITFIFFKALIAGGIVPPKQDPDHPQYVKNELLIKFKDETKINRSLTKSAARTAITSIDRLNKDYQVISMEKLFKNSEPHLTKPTFKDHLGKTHEVPNLDKIYKLQFEAKIDPIELSKEYAKDENIEYAEPNYIAQICGEPNDPSYNQQWGLTAINAPKAWDMETGDSTVVISIIDTGVEWDHPDLIDKLWINEAELNGTPGIDDDGNGYIDDIYGWNFIWDNNDPYDDNGHGTHVSGIATASTNNGIGIAGVSWGSKIMNIKALSHTGTGSYGVLAQAVNYAANNGASVINMSLGGYANSYTLQMAIENAYTNCIIIASAGNDGLSVEEYPFFPAAYPFVIGVQATDQFGLITPWSNLDPNGPTMSNNGLNYEVGAPGVSIYSTMIAHSYASWTGTSMAAPFVSGTVALLRSYYPDWSNEILLGQLVNSSSIVIDAYAALTLVPEPVLTLQDYTIIDTIPGCDEDGIVDAGETVELIAIIKNFWAQADSVETILRLARPWRDSTFVNIVDSVATLGNVSAYASKNNEKNPFLLEISNNTPNNSNILFETITTCANSESVWHDTFWLSVQRGTTINGIISEDTILSNDYLYIVNGNMLVDEGVTLTIEPGTRIQFDADKYLRIDGCLKAIGTEDSMIVFTSNCQTQIPGDWNSIKFTNSSEDAVFDSLGNYISGSILKYAEIKLCQGISIENSSPYISYCNIHDNHVMYSPGSAIYLYNSNSIIENNNIFDNSRLGGIYTVLGEPIIRHNLIEGNYHDGWGGGITIDSFTSTPCNVLVTYNIIRGNYSDTYGYSWGGGGIYMTCGTVSNNIVYDNYTNKWGSNPNFPYAGSVFIRSGEFYNNTVINNKHDGLFIKNQYNALVNSNNIINNRLSDPLYNMYDYFEVRMGSEHPLDCTNNYWGTTDPDEIDDYIWDFLDDFDLGLATYQPFATSPIVDAPGFLYQVDFDPPPPFGCEDVAFNLTFSKPMDISIQPHVTFGVTEPFTQHVMEGVWIDSTLWQGIYEFGITTGDGINHLRVTAAKDREDMEIPKDTRFSFVIDATGASSVGFIAEAGIGKVDLEWNGQDMIDLMGYNMYRYHETTDSTYSDTLLVNTSMITDTVYCDMSVVPNTQYYYMYTGISTDFNESNYSNPASALPFNADPGDANGDLAVNVLDIISIVSYILQDNPQPFLFDAADMNDDGVINVLDIIGVVNVIIGQEKTKFASNKEIETIFCYHNNQLISSSSGNIAGYQFKISGNIKNLDIKSDYPLEIVTRRIAIDTVFVLAYSKDKNYIPSGNSPILSFSKNSNYTFSDLIVSDKEGKKVDAKFGDPEDLLIPDKFELGQNYPNPFNHSTTIEYSLPEISDITIRVYNLMGQVVSVYDVKQQAPGYYHYQWNGRNVNGQLIASGIYLYQMKADGFMDTKKMVLLK